MPILFVTRYFTPEVGATQTRIHEFARACHRRGHRVTVLASLPLDAHVQFMTVISAPVASVGRGIRGHPRESKSDSG